LYALGVIIFGSVFIKKSNQTGFLKKIGTKTGWFTGSNQLVSVWLF
jgi:hypothetical protein